MNPASFYKKAERSGIFTPDETAMYDATHSLELLRAVGIHLNGNIKGLTIGSITHNGKKVATNVRVNMGTEDGVILSLCNSNRKYVQRRLGKIGGVEIMDVERLKAIIDEQVGAIGIAKSCEYTNSHNRNTFLKSIKDQWQNEFRLFWAHPTRVEIELPAGLARPLP